MRTIWGAGLGVMLALAGCSSGPAGNDAIVVADNGTEAPPRTTDKSAPLYRQAYVFEGKWAAEPALCEGGAWSFERERIRTAGELDCAITERRNETGIGVTLVTQCSAEGMAGPDRIELMTFEEGKMTVQRYAGDQLQGPQIQLVKCS